MLVSDSLPNSLTPKRLVNLIDVTLACEDAYSKLAEVVTVVNFSDEDHVWLSVQTTKSMISLLSDADALEV